MRLSSRCCSLSLAISTLLLASLPVFATDYYVDNLRGDDHNNGLDAIAGATGGGPFKTIGRALRVANSGDQISLAKNPEPYRESLTLEGPKSSGNTLQRFQIKGNGATLDGSIAVDPEAWEHFSGNVFRFRPDHPTRQILFHESKPLEEARDVLVKDLEPMRWRLKDGQIYFSVEQGRLPSQYPLTICGQQVGITLYRVNGVVISNLTIQGYRLDGVNAHDLVGDSWIQDCILRGNGRSGVSIGNASRFDVVACLIGDNRTAQVHVEGYSRVRLLQCDLVESANADRILYEGGKLTVNEEKFNKGLK
jgi:hypothetical protein